MRILTIVLLLIATLCLGCATTTTAPTNPSAVEADDAMISAAGCEFLKSFSAYGHPMGDYNYGREKAIRKIGYEADRVGGTHFVVGASEHSGAVHVAARIYRCDTEDD